MSYSKTNTLLSLPVKYLQDNAQPTSDFPFCVNWSINTCDLDKLTLVGTLDGDLTFFSDHVTFEFKDSMLNTSITCVMWKTQYEVFNDLCDLYSTPCKFFKMLGNLIKFGDAVHFHVNCFKVVDCGHGLNALNYMTHYRLQMMFDVYTTEDLTRIKNSQYTENFKTIETVKYNEGIVF